MATQPTITNNAGASRFEAQTDHGVAVLSYRLRNGAIDLAHTAVPQAAEGQGIGASLARAALEHARAQGLHVIPSCPFVKSYLAKHPEYGDLVADR
jgi:predicted GNAT family acetyltransferase